VVDAERSDLGGGVLAHEIPGIPVERPSEQDFEARDEAHDDEGARREDDEQQPPPEPEAVHPIL